MTTVDMTMIVGGVMDRGRGIGSTTMAGSRVGGGTGVGGGPRRRGMVSSEGRGIAIVRIGANTICRAMTRVSSTIGSSIRTVVITRVISNTIRRVMTRTNSKSSGVGARVGVRAKLMMNGGSMF
jgi:hypothetical protein